MARVSAVPMRTPGKHPKQAAAATGNRRSKRESKQFVPFTGVDFTVRKEKKKKQQARNVAVKKGGKVRKTRDGMRRVGRGVQKKEEKKKSKKVAKKGNDRLVARPDIKFKREHGSFGQSSYVSQRSFSRQLMAAVLNGDTKAIERIYKDEKIPEDAAGARYSCMDHRSPIVAAVQGGNEKVISTLIKCHHARATKKNVEVVAEPNLLKKKSTGKKNFHMLGRATRAIETARGGREGNNAFLNYEADGVDGIDDNLLLHLDFRDLTYAFLTQFSKQKKNGGNDPILTDYSIQGQFLNALRAGNRALASDCAQLQSHNFNNLQLESLKLNGKIPKPILAISVRKKSFIFRNITPIHTAAINPDVSYLAALRDVDPVINVPDQNNWYTMHYAAVCEGDGPIKFLLSKDVGVCDVNKQGELPLHLAAKTGRVGNVKILLEAIAKLEKSENDKVDEEENDEDDDEPRAKRAKKAAGDGTNKKSIANAKTRKGRTALHYAVWHGRTDVVKMLLASAAVDKECPNSANDKKLTPLMIAVGRGHLEIVEMLIAAGCLVEGRDKMKRSPLMIAAINGHTNIAAMLLQKGADVNRKDTSGNTAMHYACAYGWMEIGKMIVEIDKTTLAAKNEWLITPLSIAYLKGHYGIVSWLLDNRADVVDVNSKDNDGVTIISSLLSYHDEESTKHLPDQIDYLIKHGADCSITDTAGNSPLHIFAAVPLVLKVDKPARTAKGNDERITSAQFKKCLDQLVGAGADPLAKNSEGANAFTVALSAGNLYLAALLLDSYGKDLLKDELSLVDKPNAVHTLLTVPQTIADAPSMWAYADAPIGGQYNFVPLLKKIAAVVGATDMESLLAASNENGETPVLQLVASIASLSNAHSMESGQFSAFASTAMAGLRELLRMRPAAVMDRRKAKTDDTKPEEEQTSVIQLALNGRVNNRGKNFLLETLLASASENDNLAAFLTQKIVCDQVKCPVTPLIKTLLAKQEMEAVLLLRAARDGAIAEEVCGAAIEWRPKGKGDEEDEPAPSRGLPVSNGFASRKVRTVAAKPSLPFGARPSTAAAAATSATVGPAIEKEPWNKTAFHMAIQNSLLEALPHFALTDAQAAEVDASGRNAWHYAAHQLLPSTIKLFELLEGKNVPMISNTYGQTPLHVAVNAERTGSADAFLDPIEWLLEKADPAAQDGESRTALHYAFEKVNVKGKTKDLKKQDPIAVVSLLLSKLPTKAIRQRDSAGNTALHLAAMADANICLVSMLAKGSEVDTPNNDGNSALALALLAKSQAASLTLIQAHADINGPVLGPEPKKPKEKPYRYLGAPLHKEERIRSTIPDTVVRNEWHSLVYVILDLLGKTPETIAKLVAAALRNGQHNFSIYLLKLLGKPTAEVQRAMVAHDFLSLYVESLAGPVEGPAATVLDRIFEMKVPFISAAGHSPVVERACRKGHYKLLEKLAAADPARFETIKPQPGGTSPIQALVERWLESTSSEQATIRYWLQRFASFAGLNLETPIALPDRALPGSKDALVDLGLGNGCMVSPLCAAIRAQSPELIRFLVAECKVDVNNQCPRPPITDAVITNNAGVVKALVDGEAEDPHAVVPQANGFANGKKAPTRGAAFLLGAGMPNAAASPSDSDDDMEGSDASEDEEDNAVNESENEDTPPANPDKPIDLKGKIAAIDIAAKDRATGRSVAHFLVAPCGWQNVQLLEALSRAYKNKFTQLLTMRDNDGVTPIAMAAQANQHKMMESMIKNANRPTSDALAGLLFYVPAETTCNVKSDSDALLKEFAETLAKKKDEKKIRIPHKKSGYEKTGEILECEQTKQLFQVLLNKTDLRGGLYGFHNYYKMELIKRKDADLFILFTNWGRIGDPYGEFQCTPFTNFDAAVKEYKSVFKQKTGQEWCPLADFSEKPGKYRLTKTEDDVQTAADVDIDNFRLEKEDEDKPEMKFVADVANVKQLRRYSHSLQLSNFSSVSCPFGRVAKEEIQRAREILVLLDKNIQDMDKARDKKPPNMDDIFRLTDEQYTLTSSFYTTIPVGGYTHSNIRVISSPHELQAAYAILNTIGEIEIAGRLVSAAEYARKKRGEDPLRYVLSAVDCSLKIQSPQEELSQRVLQWISASKKHVDVRAIFSINSRRAAQAMEKHRHCDNVTFLLHGTKAENLLSILHYGLKATPSNALQCGQAFGSGVYFADAFEKSESYCGSSSQGLKYMLICKVALGTVIIKDDLAKKDKFDTRKVQGSKGPRGSLTIDGASMPLGPLVDNVFTGTTQHYWRPPHNEFVVKDESRILPVMIVAFKD